MQVFHVGHPIPNEDLGMAGTIHQSDDRLACCRKRWRRRLNDDDDDDDGDYVDGMLLMGVMVTVMLIMLMEPTKNSVAVLAQVV